MEFLSAMDYEIVTFATGYHVTEIENWDHYLSPRSESSDSDESFWFQVNPFEVLLLQSTALSALPDPQQIESLRQADLFSGDLTNTLSRLLYQQHRERILFSFEHLADFASREGDYFVFAHILAPHPPFVFDSRGEATNPDAFYSLKDAGVPDYVDGYREHLTFTNSLLKVAISEILEASDSPPIIVIQGDHGPGSRLNWEAGEIDLNERMSIFNAYLLPGAEGILYPEITPVNSFRLIFNCYFGANLELLEDRSYFSGSGSPYDFEEVTTKLR
jgi:hypothetical protein